MKLQLSTSARVVILLLCAVTFSACSRQGDNVSVATPVEQYSVGVTVSEKDILLDYNFPRPTITGNDVSIKGLTGTLTGYVLPVSEVWIALPKDTFADNLKIDVVSDGTTEGVKIKQTEVDTLGGTITSSGAVTASITVQEKNGIYFAVFTVLPCSYDENNGKLTYSTSLKVRASLSSMQWDMMRLNDDTLSWLRERVENPEMLESYQ